MSFNSTLPFLQRGRPGLSSFADDGYNQGSTGGRNEGFNDPSNTGLGGYGDQGGSNDQSDQTQTQDQTQGSQRAFGGDRNTEKSGFSGSDSTYGNTATGGAFSDSNTGSGATGTGQSDDFGGDNFGGGNNTSSAPRGGSGGGYGSSTTDDVSDSAQFNTSQSSSGNDQFGDDSQRQPQGGKPSFGDKMRGMSILMPEPIYIYYLLTTPLYRQHGESCWLCDGKSGFEGSWSGPQDG